MAPRLLKEQLAPRHQRLKRTALRPKRQVSCFLHQETTMNIHIHDRTTDRRLIPARPRRAARDVRQIHPSWLERDYQQPGGDLAPEEFWTRLGM